MYMLVYLFTEKAEKQRQADRESIHWFIHQMPAINSWANTKPEPEAQNFRSSTYMARTQPFEPSAPWSTGYINKKLKLRQSQDSDPDYPG